MNLYLDHKNYCTTQLNIAWSHCSLKTETQWWILESEAHFWCKKIYTIPRQSCLGSKMLCLEMVSLPLSSLYIFTMSCLYGLTSFKNIVPRNIKNLESQPSLQNMLCRNSRFLLLANYAAVITFVPFNSKPILLKIECLYKANPLLKVSG